MHSGLTAGFLIPLAAIYVLIANRLALRPFKRSHDRHWSEQARLLHPAVCSARHHVIWLPLVTGMTVWNWFHYPPLAALASGLATLAAVLLATYDFARQILPNIVFKDWVRETSVAWIFRLTMWGTLIIFGIIMPPEASAWCVMVGLLYLALSAILNWGGALALCRHLNLIQAAPPDFSAMCQTEAARQNVRCSRVWIIPSQAANAFALPLTRDLLFTKKCISILSPEQLVTVAAHELAHLSESRGIGFLRWLSSLWCLPWIFFKPAYQAYSLNAFWILWAMQMAIIVAARYLAGRMENRADAVARKQEPSPAAYATALLAIYRANLTPAVLPRHKDVHAHLYDRMLAAGVQPDFARPKAPADFNFFTLLTIALWIASVGTCLVHLIH